MEQAGLLLMARYSILPSSSWLQMMAVLASTDVRGIPWPRQLHLGGGDTHPLLDRRALHIDTGLLSPSLPPPRKYLFSQPFLGSASLSRTWFPSYSYHIPTSQGPMYLLKVLLRLSTYTRHDKSHDATPLPPSHLASAMICSLTPSPLRS